jgi:CHASE2 domain-containing sensor protein
VVLIFWLITFLVCVQTMYKSSFTVGASALAACALCYIGASGFMGSLLARREKNYRALDLAAIGAIALVVIGAGSALMMWSGFWMRLFDVEIGGVTWALLGAVSAVVVVRKADALGGL